MNSTSFELSDDNSFVGRINKNEIEFFEDFHVSWLPDSVKDLGFDSGYEDDSDMEVEILSSERAVLERRLDDTLAGVFNREIQRVVADGLISFSNQISAEEKELLRVHYGSLDSSVIGFDIEDDVSFLEKNLQNIREHSCLYRIVVGDKPKVVVFFFNCTWNEDHGCSVTLDMGDSNHISIGNIYDEWTGSVNGVGPEWR